MRVLFTYAGGRERSMSKREANILQKLGRGTYMTRDMIAAPVMQNTLIPATDDLDGMERDELRALAQDLGLQVHHASGVDKVRAAIREHRAAHA